MIFQVGDNFESRGFRLAGGEAIINPDSDDDEIDDGMGLMMGYNWMIGSKSRQLI